MAAGISGFVSRAEHIAQKRGDVASTGHLLLALLEIDAEAEGLLSRHGVTRAAVVKGLAQAYDEPSHAIDLAMERATKLRNTLATTFVDERDAGGVVALHGLLVLLRDSRSAAHQLLRTLGAPVAVLQQAALQHLPGADASTAEGARLPPRTVEAPRKRRTVGRDDQVALAVATESKRNRRVPPRPTKPSRRSAAPEQALAEPAVQGTPPEPARPTVAATREPLSLDPERFPLLCQVGRDLTQAARDGDLDPVVGREAEIEQLLEILCRRRANNPLVVGAPGVGKTAIVEGLAAAVAGLPADAALADVMLLEVSAGALLSGTGVRGALGERLTALRQEVQAAEHVILFFDEIHALLGAGEGAEGVANELKTALSRGELPCIGTTTDAEYRRVFDRDPALARRFTRVDVEPPDLDSALRILKGLAPRYERHHTLGIAPDALEAAVEMAHRFLSDAQLPDSAVGLVDQAAARTRRAGGRIVGREAVAEVVAARTGVPRERLLMQDGEVLMALDEGLRARVAGQDVAIEAIVGAVRRSAAGFRGQRPLGTFLFLGSTGVGKTEMAKALSDLVFPSCPLVRVDMSEYSEAHAVARLLGAPPGYVGHEDGGQLTEPVRKRGYCLVLLDEVEKAHPEVLLSLLPLLDEGHVTDGRGRRVDFRNTIVVMTSNLGASVVGSAPARGIGFGAGPRDPEPSEQGQRVIAAARAALPPELWNRIDEPLYFCQLSRQVVGRIAKRLLEGVARSLDAQHGVTLDVDDSVVDALIAAGGFDPELGARPLKRTIARMVEAPLAEAILSGVAGPGKVLGLRGDGSQILVETGCADAAE